MTLGPEDSHPGHKATTLPTWLQNPPILRNAGISPARASRLVLTIALLGAGLTLVKGLFALVTA